MTGAKTEPVGGVAGLFVAFRRWPFGLYGDDGRERKRAVE